MTINLKYTPQQETELTVEYKALKTHDEREEYILKFMLKHNKTKRSVVAKLSKLEIYVSRPKVSKVTGDKARTKEQMVTEMTTIMGFSTGELEGLDKTPKLVLVKLLKREHEIMDTIASLKAQVKSLLES